MRDEFTGKNRFGIDAEAIERSVREAIDAEGIGHTVRESLKGLDTTLRNLGLSSSVADVGDDVEERRFAVGSGSELFVESSGSEISIRTGQSSIILVRVTGHDDEDDGGSAVTMNQAGNRVEIRTALSRASSHDVELEIEVPEGCSVTVQTDEADVDIRGTHAPVSVVAEQGDVDVQDASAECAVRTTQGDITLRRITGRLNLHTTDGDSEILESRLGSCSVHSTNGDVTLETSLARPGEYKVETVNGDVELLIARGTGATVELRSANGDVSAKVPAEVLESGAHHWRGEINGGGAQVKIGSANGDLELVESKRISSAIEPVPAATAAPEQSAVNDVKSADETSDVLGALERGEISVDEAMARLDELA
jgi:Putative adhesin